LAISAMMVLFQIVAGQTRPSRLFRLAKNVS
jgi:hypothetical protein